MDETKLEVLGAMRKVLTERREPLGPSSRSRVAGSYGSGDRVVYNFEKGRGGPEYDKLDGFFAAYAEVIETPMLDLWREAIQRAEAEAKRLAGDLGPDVGVSTEIAERARDATERSDAADRDERAEGEKT